MSLPSKLARMGYDRTTREALRAPHVSRAGQADTTKGCPTCGRAWKRETPPPGREWTAQELAADPEVRARLAQMMPAIPTEARMLPVRDLASLSPEERQKKRAQNKTAFERFLARHGGRVR